MRWCGDGLVRRRRLRLRVVVGFHFGRAVLVRTTVDHRLEVEVAVAWWARRLPFKRVRMPRITTRFGAKENAVEKVDGEDDLRSDHQERANTHELIEGQQMTESLVVVWVGITPRET